MARIMTDEFMFKISAQSVRNILRRHELALGSISSLSEVGKAFLFELNIRYPDAQLYELIDQNSPAATGKLRDPAWEPIIEIPRGLLDTGEGPRLLPLSKAVSLVERWPWLGKPPWAHLTRIF